MSSSEIDTVTPPTAEIHDRGRGPEIKGTRITVYSILDCALECWPPERIANWFNITSAQVEAAIAYIREHTIEVLTTYIKILERNARGNPPEDQAKLDASRERLRELAKEIHEVKSRADADIQNLIQKYRGIPAEGNANAGNYGRQ